MARPPTIVLAPTGTLGDIHPFIAVALRLRELGCRPIMAVMDDYHAAVAAEGIETRLIRPCRRDMESAGHDDASIARAVQADLRAGFDVMLPHLAATYADLAALMREADVVVGGSLSTAARIAAEAARVPVVTLILQPMGFLSAAEPPLMSEAPWLQAVGKRCGPSAVRALYRLASWRGRASLRPAARLRRRLGLPRLRDELLDGPRRSARIVALYPPTFAALPTDAPAQAVSAGFSFYDGPAVPLEPALERFVAAGPPPLVFTLGSFVVHAPGDFFTASVTAAKQVGRRAVLLVGRHAVDRYRNLADDQIAIAGYAAHSTLLPRAAAVIHHGGIGTSAQALRAGVAQLVCPFFGDQFDNADRLRRLGIASVLPLRRYDEGAVVTALEELLDRSLAPARARRLASEIGAVDGPRLAAAEIAALAQGQASVRLRRVV